MKFKIPFTIGSIDNLKQKSKIFARIFTKTKESYIYENLVSSEIPLTREEYLGIVLRSFIFVFLSTYVVSTTIFFLIGLNNFYLLGLGISALFSLFVGMNQLIYPKIFNTRRQQNIEKNLIPALEDILVQLNSGIPLFNILVNISSSDYGELSEEFKKAVKKINTGKPQIDVLEEISRKNTSKYFRRALWQISNGMKAGSDIAIVIKESLHSLNEEQILQIQSYGNKLNPMIMFYMLISIILPALAITFLTIISSFINASEKIVVVMFIGLFVIIIFIQITFLGAMKSMRPTLLT